MNPPDQFCKLVFQIFYFLHESNQLLSLYIFSSKANIIVSIIRKYYMLK